MPASVVVTVKPGMEMAGPNNEDTANRVSNEPTTLNAEIEKENDFNNSEYFSDSSEDTFASAQSHLEDTTQEEYNNSQEFFNDTTVENKKSLTVLYSNIDKNLFKKFEPFSTFADNNNIGIWAIAEPTIPVDANPPEKMGFKCEMDFPHRLVVYHKEKLELKKSEIISKVPMIMLQGRDTTWVFLYSTMGTGYSIVEL